MMETTERNTTTRRQQQSQTILGLETHWDSPGLLIQQTGPENTETQQTQTMFRRNPSDSSETPSRPSPTTPLPPSFLPPQNQQTEHLFIQNWPPQQEAVSVIDLCSEFEMATSLQETETEKQQAIWRYALFDIYNIILTVSLSVEEHSDQMMSIDNESFDDELSFLAETSLQLAETQGYFMPYIA